MTKRELVRKIRKEFPDLKFKNARHNVEGWDHYVLILDNKYVFRFPREADYKNQLFDEIRLLEYLRPKVKIPIPKYIYIAKDKSFAGYEMLSGVQLKKEVFRKLSKQSQKFIAKQAAEFLTTLHKISLKDVKAFRIPKTKTQWLYRDLVRNTKKYIYPRIPSRDQELIENYLREFKKYLKFPNLVLAHCDFYHDHILLDLQKKQISAVIDFSDRHINDPAIDFTELWIYGSGFVHEVYKHYKGPKDPEFLKRSQMYCKRNPLWIMAAPFLGQRGKFKKGYEIFREIFDKRELWV